MSTSENGENEKMGGLAQDLSSLTRSQLKAKYQCEYNSWRNGKQRAKALGNWSPAFDDFANFLKELGPCPPGHTLDRKAVNDLMYAPGLVRWASKREQANNRSSTRFVTYKGEAQPSADAARAEGMSPAAFRQRVYRKQSEESAFQQMVEDFEHGVGGDPRLFRPWPRHREGLSAEWEELWKRSGGLRRGNSRYDFFIRKLQDTQSQIQDELNILEDRDIPRTDQRWDLLSDDFGRTRKHLLRALNERPVWEGIVRRHELRKRADKNERDALQHNSYLRPGEDDGE